MTTPPQASPEEELRLAPESVEAIARRVAELVAQEAGPSQPRRLLTAAEVSEWWGVERSWVYANAGRLGARRLGAGERPRLRFDPQEVAERLGSPARRHDNPAPPIDGRRSLRIAVDSIPGEAELSSSRKSEAAGRRVNAPGPTPKGTPSARRPA